MAHTLGCLVASMTAGAVVLDYVQPDRPASQRRAIELIAQGGTIAQQWNSIRVAPQRAEATAQNQSHFLIDAEGNCLATDSWRTQRSLGRPSQVRIGLQASTNSNQITPSQWDTAQELIGALQRMCAITQQADLDDTIALPSTPAPSAPAGRPVPSSTRLKR